MYNSHMLKFILISFLCILTSGCAMNEGYNPVAAATTGTYELNQSALKKVTVGMTLQQVHDIMGQTIIIGYTNLNAAQGSPAPVTLNNPYKTSDVEEAKGKCTVEYYVTSVVIPDGVVSDTELMPLKFCQGVLTAKGWDKLK